MTGSYQRVADLAEARLELARLGEWESLAATDAQQGALRATLGPAVPADREALERALVAESQLAVLAADGMATTRRELGRLHGGRRAVRGYGQLAASRPVGALA